MQSLLFVFFFRCFLNVRIVLVEKESFTVNIIIAIKEFLSRTKTGENSTEKSKK